jgi:hypothetical protein
MRSSRILSGLQGVVLALAAVTGCDGGSEGQTDLAKLPPPPQAAIDAAKTQAPPTARPKFGSPPRSATVKP